MYSLVVGIQLRWADLGPPDVVSEMTCPDDVLDGAGQRVSLGLPSRSRYFLFQGASTVDGPQAPDLEVASRS